ncbi:uncharacterized protein LOC143896475 [Temnothorax americanus]|uniref:uncharacterized protein LOC143896475 n=1 Tax=Temnothorax americanus TaxID=1964332 RepID=UPI00406876F2
MFSFEGCNSSSSSSNNNGAKRMNTMNYYVPIHDVETQTYEKKCNSISLDRRAVRILSRRYALTATEYKFLEIDINVGPPSYVEIAVGDPRRGKELLLSLETWKALYEQWQNVQNFFRNDFKDIHSFINVGPLTDPKEASNVIYASDAFNMNQIVDCELAALVF